MKLMLRGTLGVSNFLCFGYAVKALNLSEAMTIIYTMPIFTGILGAIFLKEKFRLLEIMLSISGILGVICIFKPPFVLEFFGYEVQDEHNN